MSSRRILLAVAVGVAALLVVGLWLRRDRAGAPSSEQSPERAHQGIRVADVAVVSPDLDVGLVEIRGTVHPDYTDWSCILECREAEGCRADVRLMIEYRSNGASKKVLLGSRLDANRGETMRIGRVQRPPDAVESIDRATLSVLEAYRSNSPRPTEIE
jgi:hypothetical protein